MSSSSTPSSTGFRHIAEAGIDVTLVITIHVENRHNHMRKYRVSRFNTSLMVILLLARKVFALWSDLQQIIAGTPAVIQLTRLSKGEGFRGVRPTSSLLFTGRTAKTAAAGPGSA
jgi:hypothetical protein